VLLGHATLHQRVVAVLQRVAGARKKNTRKKMIVKALVPKNHNL